MNCPKCENVLRDEAVFCDRCGASIVSHEAPNVPGETEKINEILNPNDVLIGQVIDAKYELIAPIGQGGMGVVYRARRRFIGDEVAIKILLQKYIADESALERFRREARAAAMLHHPNVVTIFDYGEPSRENTFAYIVMELLEGESLRDLLRREGRLAPEKAVRLLREICVGVSIAHRHNILHRDLKPDNIIIISSSDYLERELVKVVDFGIAKLRDFVDVLPLTQAGELIGTPHYMSPEQCKDEPLDVRSDIYSLGIMFYEMLTGSPPYIATNPAGVIGKHLTAEPPPLPKHLGIHPALEGIIKTALAKNPDARYQNILEMARKVQEAYNSPPVEVYEPPPKTLKSIMPPPPIVNDSVEPLAVNNSGSEAAKPKRSRTADAFAVLKQFWRQRILHDRLLIGLSIGIVFSVIVALLWILLTLNSTRNEPLVSPKILPAVSPTPLSTPYDRTFSNSTSIKLPASGSAGVASSYPSNIDVADINGTVSKIVVQIKNIKHTLTNDIDIVLVGPMGQSVVLMSDVGNSTRCENTTLTFDDAAAEFPVIASPTATVLSSPVPNRSSGLSNTSSNTNRSNTNGNSSTNTRSIMKSGKYKPTNYGKDVDAMPNLSGAPGVALSIFNNTNPNGIWKLYIYDDASVDMGEIEGGWSLIITINPSVSTPIPATPLPTF